MKGMKMDDILKIISDPKKAYLYAKDNNANEYFLKSGGNNHFIFQNKLVTTFNILEKILEVEEKNRLSSVKLMLVCQLDKLILSRVNVPYE